MCVTPIQTNPKKENEKVYNIDKPTGIHDNGDSEARAELEDLLDEY